jgi:bis(5'-nucleosyl)-tetraphosphatase (symmetrical)
MAVYLIGDVQGCDEPLARLLAAVDFSPSRDTAYFLGDMVNRGPDSLAVLRRLSALGDAAQAVLGNHDLHALAVATGVRSARRSDTLGALLAAPDTLELQDWLRSRPLAIHAHGVLMVHAGVLPQWTLAQTLSMAEEVSQALQEGTGEAFLRSMYGDSPTRWSDDLAPDARLRVATNALTRLRFCSASGEMDMAAKGGPETAPAGFMPWFDVPGRASALVPIAFGHWSTLGLHLSPGLMGLDTGCAWGGTLTALALRDGGRHEVVSVPATPAP